MEPMRLAILAHLRDPESAAGVARALALPRQRVGYHVRELEKARLVRFVGARRRGNCLEHLLQATAACYVVGPQALGAMGATSADAGRFRDRFSSAYLIAAASRTIGDVAMLRERARSLGKTVPTLTLETEIRFAGPEQQRAFANELTEAMARLATKYHNASTARGRPFRIVVSGHPCTDRE